MSNIRLYAKNEKYAWLVERIAKEEPFFLAVVVVVATKLYKPAVATAENTGY